MQDNSIGKRLALGATAGLAGTLMIYALRSASGRYAPQTMPPLREEPGEFMVHKAEQQLADSIRSQIPEGVRKGSSMALAFVYGIAFGMLYATTRPRGGPILRDGVLLGLAAWAAGYLGWLPLSGLMPPVWKLRPAQAISPPVRHSAYGAATVAAYDLLAATLA